jgi:hypothetical protein
MPQYSSVYYPHTTLRTPDLLRTALLLWDHVDCIVPWQGFSVTEELPQELAGAAEIILRPRHPTAEEKARVHAEVVDAFSLGIPEWVRVSMDTRYSCETQSYNYQEYAMYSRKLMSETWDQLIDSDLARSSMQRRDMVVPSALGLALMASLAGVLAGAEQYRITDHVSAYCTLFRMSGGLPGRRFSRTPTDAGTSEFARLVTVSTNIIDSRTLSTERLVELRTREAKDASGDLRRLRHHYLDGLREHLTALSSAQSPSDATQLIHTFREKMELDLYDLKRELGMARNDLLLSKAVGIAVLAFGSSFSLPISMGPLSEALRTVGAGSLARTGIKLARARREAFQTHAMSWLYLSETRGREWW